MHDDETPCRLALARLAAVGDRARRTLLEHYGSAQAIFEDAAGATERLAADPGVRQRLSAGPEALLTAADRRWAAEGGRLLALPDRDYPTLLREIPDPPPLLFVHGDPAWLARPQLAIVGSRNPSPAGRELTRAFSARLAAAGLTITSGLALGVDGCAHAAALEAGGGTVAVAGTGLDRVYPPQHRALAGRIAQRGCLVSELPPGSPPRRPHFPRRNRLISGLSLGVLVTEAALRSGSLITARLAAEQGREVFAVPGSIHSPLSRGCHRLLREGAKLVETAADILEELGPLAACLNPASGEAPAAPTAGVPVAGAERLLAALDHSPADLETLVRRTGLTAGALSSMLLAMELQGLVQVSPGGRYVRSPHLKSQG